MISHHPSLEQDPGQLSAREHAVLFTSASDVDALVLGFLKAGFDQGEAAVYVASKHSPVQIREAMRQFGEDVERLEDTGALRMLDCKQYYLVNGSFDPSRILEDWKRACDMSLANGFTGFRAVGEMDYFFRGNLVADLIRYERAVGSRFESPMAAICVYDSRSVAEWGLHLLLDLVGAHNTTLIHNGSLIRTSILELNELLSKSVEEALRSTLGATVAQAAYAYLQINCDLGKSQIPFEYQKFEKCLGAMFGVGGLTLRRVIARRVFNSLEFDGTHSCD